jgi:hypothetical protein
LKAGQISLCLALKTNAHMVKIKTDRKQITRPRITEYHTKVASNTSLSICQSLPFVVRANIDEATRAIIEIVKTSLDTDFILPTSRKVCSGIYLNLSGF